ncbi:MAG TPA: LuxR C-terminal-related transcriptional regulator [Acidimicrobiales bacterium]|nr:LuxR C-terminal-related transcriptional regulator [Acidimicrobiales bacterium]
MALRSAVDDDVLIADGSLLRFRDESERQAICSGVPEAMQGALHLRIGRVLLQRGGAPADAAAHLALGAQPGDLAALSCLDAAVAQAVLLSPSHAAGPALRALQLTDRLDDARDARTVTAIHAMVRAGRVTEATDLAQDALLQPELAPTMAAQIRLTLSRVLFMDGRPRRALDQAEAVVALPSLPPDAYTEAELARLLCLLAEDDLRPARAQAEAILAGLDRSGADGALAGALGTLSMIAWRDGQVADALGLARAAVQRSDRQPLAARRLYPRLWTASLLTSLGQFDEAAQLIRAAEHEIERAADPTWEAAPAIFRSQLRVAAGRLDEAVAEDQAGLARAEQLGTRFFVPAALSVLATASLHRGDLLDAERQIGRYLTQPPSTRAVFGPATYLWNQVRMVEAQEGPARSVQSVPAAFDDLPPSLLLEHPSAAAWLVRVAASAGDLRRAASVVARAEQLARDNREFPSVTVAARHARAMLDRDAAALERAGRAHTRPWAQASALEDGAVVLAHDGDVERSRQLLGEARAIYEGVGADRDEARARARLRGAGVRHRHRQRSDRPLSGWASLTDVEQRVAELVAEGLTNVQVARRVFLSRHTVDSHLRQIFRKLDVGSRVELTRLVIEQASSG